MAKKVWVTYDPLLEKVVCVHDAPDCLCEVCKPLWNERVKDKRYHLEEHVFEIKKFRRNIN